jgi:ATP phosphoribosyltransferase involved in histidine biosynthesis
MTSRYPSFAADILALFAERDVVLTHVDILQPADPFLDMAGEDLRRRIYMTESETGESLCLRPDFTIPVCLDHIASRASTPRRYGYLGEVFRQRREGRAEFFQAGIEDLGSPDRAEADARSLCDATALIARLLPSVPLTITVGDKAMFEAVLSALGLPGGLQKRLLRAFGTPDRLSAAIEEFRTARVSQPLPAEIAGLVLTGDERALAAYIETAMVDMGFSPGAGRHPREIARRLIEKRHLDSVTLSEQALQALRDFLAIRVPLSDAVATLADFAGRAGIAIDEALANFEKRNAAIAAAGVSVADVRYNSGFGRPLDYYTGLVFEITTDRLALPLAGGGRYDRLLTLLGAQEPIPGVGFSVWLDRVDTLREAR